jgi:hypothetical protein
MLSTASLCRESRYNCSSQNFLYFTVNIIVIVQPSRYLHAGGKVEGMYSSYSFLTSALDGASDQRHAPAAL